MEKKGDALTQLAIISDLLEKVNIESSFTTVIFDLKDEEFTKIFNKVAEKTMTYGVDLEKTFTLKIGEIEFIFNKSNA